MTPPLVAPVKERASAIEGACIPGSIVRITIKTSKGSVRLDDAACSEAARTAAALAGRASAGAGYRWHAGQ